MNGHTLISAEDLSALLERARQDASVDVLVLDCRFNLAAPQAGQEAHAQGHVPGALYAHLDRDLSGLKTGMNGRHPLPTTEAWTTTLQRWGVQPHTEVIAYDDAGGMFGARVWWMLRWVGHDRVRVLDGGWTAWRNMGGEVDTDGTPPRAPSDFAARWNADQSLVEAGFVQAHLHDRGALLLIDARAPDRFRGENETLDPVGGHIPGALNRFFQHNLGPDGRFKQAEALRSEFTYLLDGRPPDTVVHQCGSGVTACHNLLAMAHAGMDTGRLYGGSWSEWCSDPSRPIATS